MPRTLRALLVGINDYRPPVPPLDGCVNDVDAFQAYLEARVEADSGVQLDLKVLRNHEATYDRIIDEFRSQLGKAQKDDVALFYFAGHGSQERAPEEFWHLEPDRLDETLVCYDSRSEGKFDLADKELSALIEEVSSTGAHLAVILDCCHSGSGTRNVAQQATRVRRAPTDPRVRRIADFRLTDQQRARLLRGGGAAEGGKGVAWPTGRHILLAACRDEQEASEHHGDGRPRGAFSYFLGDSLRKATGRLSYRDLFARTAALIQAHVLNQTPQLETATPDDLSADFLGGAIRPTDPYYIASPADGQWWINGGSVHGVPPHDPASPMELALFPFDAPPEALRDHAKAVARAKVVEVGPVRSRLEVPGLDPGSQDTYKAVVASIPLPAMGVSIEGDERGRELARRAMAQAGLKQTPSLYVRDAGKADDAEFRLIARDGQFQIARPADDRPIVQQVDGLDEAGARKVVEQLEHIARWSLASRLANPASTIEPGEIEVAILVGGQPATSTAVRLEYHVNNGRWVAPGFKIRLKNNGPRRLHVGLLDLPETFGIFSGLIEAGSIPIDPGQEAWAFRGQEITASVPDELWKQGVVELRDILKVIISTDSFDPGLMAQPDLGLPRKPPAETRSGRASSALDQLMKRVQTRHLGAQATDPDDWTTKTIVFATLRPQDQAAVPAPGAEPAKLNGGVRVLPHPGLQGAKARLTAAPAATRALGNLGLPYLLRDDPSVSQPFVVAPTRSGSPGLSVLELSGVDTQAAGSVTPEQPLRVATPATLGPDEHVLPVAFDGEFFLPLGRAVPAAGGGTELLIERLPKPLSGDSPAGPLPEPVRRSLTGSIKIFFQKVVSGVLGRDFEYPLLAAADVDESGGKEEVVYEKDPDRIKVRIAQAHRILLMIHGVIGDTLEIRRGLRRAKVGPENKPLDSLCDLVLTLDYENLNTPIEQIARKLKERLEAVGLAEGHRKDLTIVAHSMGGLVSRWFIEREGGNKIASRLIMLGTPNGGSPWPNVHDWAIGTLAVGLNGLATVAWPAAIVGGLVAGLERLDVNLDQMQPGSSFLKDLSQSKDPGIPYVMLAGNTSLSPAGLVVDTTGLSPVGRLLARLFSKPLPHSLADMLFRDEENDIAVSVASMRNVPGPWNPTYDVRPVACDHISYFSHKAGLEALAKALSPT